MMTASVPGMPRVGSRMRRMRRAVTSRRYGHQLDVGVERCAPGPFPGRDAGTGDRPAFQHRLSVKARHTRSTGTDVGAIGEAAVAATHFLLLSRAIQATGGRGDDDADGHGPKLFLTSGMLPKVAGPDG
jgi:hypothetical protein